MFTDNQEEKPFRFLGGFFYAREKNTLLSAEANDGASWLVAWLNMEA